MNVRYESEIVIMRAATGMATADVIVSCCSVPPSLIRLCTAHVRAVDCISGVADVITSHGNDEFLLSPSLLASCLCLRTAQLPLPPGPPTERALAGVVAQRPAARGPNDLCTQQFYAVYAVHINNL